MKKRLTTKDFKELILSHPNCPKFEKPKSWHKPKVTLQELANTYKGFADFTEMILRQRKAVSIIVKRQTLCFVWENGNGSYFLDEIGMDILLPQIEEICQERGFAIKNYDCLTAMAA